MFRSLFTLIQLSVLLVIALAVPAQANYPSQISRLLDVGATTVTVLGSGGGGNGPLILTLAPTGSQRVRITLSPINAPPSSGSTYSACADPCSVSMNRSWGQQYYWIEYVDSSGNPLNPSKVSQRNTLPMIEPGSSAPGSWTLPLEVIGQDNYVRRVQFTVPNGSATTNLRLYARINNHNCATEPFDQKMSVQVNGGAMVANDGGWISINNTTAAELDEFRYFGNWPILDDLGNTDIVNGPVPNAAIGGAVGTLDLSVPIPDNLLMTGTNSIGFRQFCGDGNTSGYRVLAFNFQDTTTIKQLDQISVTNNVATATAHTTHGFGANDWVFIYGAPGIRARFNGGRKVISSPTGTTFTFTPCGTNGNALSCTSPSGSYTVPVSQNPSIAMATQPAIYAVRHILPESSFTQEDRTAWTAPGGGAGSNGNTLFHARNSLVNPWLPYLNYSISVACSDCHTETGSDLKYYAFSNNSIVQRTVFHGLTYQDGLDIAAYIRGLAISVPATATPWNPVYQPCPGIDSGTVNDWAGGGGLDCVTTYAHDTDEYMIPGGSFATWAPGSYLNMRELPQQWQFQDWIHWIPMIHPNDFFPSLTFFSGPLYASYRNFRSTVTPNNFLSYKAYSATRGSYTLYDSEVPFKISTGQPGMTYNSAGFIRPAQFLTGYFSIQLWNTLKTWELEHEYGLESMLSQVYTDLYGAAVSPAGYQTRGWWAGTVFNTGYHKAITSTFRGTLNGNLATHNYQSNIWYLLQCVINCGNLRATGDRFMDWAYTWAFLTGSGQYRPNGNFSLLPIIVEPQGGWDQPTPYQSGPEASAFSPPTANFAFGFGARYGHLFTTPGQFTASINQFANTLNTILYHFSVSAWQTYASAQNDVCTTPFHAYQSSGNQCESYAFALPLLSYYGVNAATIDSIQSRVAAIWPARNFAYDRSSAATGVINVTGGAATWVSGDKFTNFGVDGSGSPAIQSSVHIGGVRYPITAVSSTTAMSLGGSPPDGSNQTYTRCAVINPGGVPPGWPICGNVQ